MVLQEHIPPSRHRKQSWYTQPAMAPHKIYTNCHKKIARDSRCAQYRPRSYQPFLSLLFHRRLHKECQYRIRRRVLLNLARAHPRGIPIPVKKLVRTKLQFKLYYILLTSTCACKCGAEMTTLKLMDCGSSTYDYGSNSNLFPYWSIRDQNSLLSIVSMTSLTLSVTMKFCWIR